MKRHELSDAQWERIKDILPPEWKPKGGRPAKDNRVMLNGMMKREIPGHNRKRTNSNDNDDRDFVVIKRHLWYNHCIDEVNNLWIYRLY